MITKIKFWTVASVLVVTGLATSSALTLRLTTPAAPRTDAAWAFVATNPRTLATFADAIVVAEAVATYPGRVANSADGEDVLPFQIVQLKVRDALKGSFPDGRVYLERAGGIEPQTGIVHNIDIDGGEFEAGHTYLLFLNAQPGDSGFYYQVNDQGRYELAGSRLKALEPEADLVQQVFHHRTLAEATAIVRKLVE